MFSKFKDFDRNKSFKRLQKKVNNIQFLMNSAIQNASFIDPYTKSLISSDTKGTTFSNGLVAKTSLIRSQKLIYELHEFVKEEFVYYGIKPELILPPINCSNPEVNITGRFKQKKQDVCIVPNHIENKPEPINWGILKNSGKQSIYGSNKEGKILSVNIRSQLSSLSKNSDTLFERMIAEPLNLHLQYPKMVTGELYMIPVYEYEDKCMKQNILKFKSKLSDLEKYITFFTDLNGFNSNILEEPFKYNHAGLLIVDFNRSTPKIYTSTKELKDDGLISSNFDLELSDISPVNLPYKLLLEYKDLHNENGILKK